MIALASLVVVYLVDPREKYWGRLERLDAVGVELRGMDLGMVEEWARELGRGEVASMGPSTVFFPLKRVEKIFLDEDVGAARSVSRSFHEIVGVTPLDYLAVPRPPRSTVRRPPRRRR